MKKNIVLFSLLFLTVTPTYCQADHWETVVYENLSWKYLEPTAPVPANWNTMAFVDTAWNSAPGGFGYGDGDDNMIITNAFSIFQRITFTIIDTADIDDIILNIDFDDAYVAFINGAEISRSNISATGSPPYNLSANGEHEAVMYAGGYPDQVVINKSTWKNFITNGNNLLCVQTHNVSAFSSDMSTRVWLQLGMKTPGMTYGPTPAWFVPPFVFNSSNLPIVVINTQGQNIPDEPKIMVDMGIIYNGAGAINYLSDPFNHYNGKIGIEIRGSSSAWFPKKPYGFETWNAQGVDTSVSLLGMPYESDWILNANYSDKSLLNNHLAYKLSNDAGMYAPRTQFVEMVMDGQYMGVYVLMEKIKKDANRVNIATLLPGDTLGPELTGGYIIKIDKTTGNGGGGWTSNYPPLANGGGQTIYYQYEYPSDLEIQPNQADYIQQYVDDFESALNSQPLYNTATGWRAYADEFSFIKYFILNEISKNVDGYRISTYLYKHKITWWEKLFIGPPWDYDLGFGNANYCDGSVFSGWAWEFGNVCPGDGLQIPFWWEKFAQDTIFQNNLKCVYTEMRQTSLNNTTLFNYIDSIAGYLDESQTRNFMKWPILGTYVWPNPAPFPGSYVGEIAELKNWLMNRMAWLDANLTGTCTNLSVTQTAEEKQYITASPNPFENQFQLSFLNFKSEDAVYELRNINGQLIETDNFNLTTGNTLFSLPRNNTLVPGLYVLTIRTEAGIHTLRVVCAK
ncbi:MAG: CotH kinase family protein [Flavobacteriales bacterium]